MAEAREEVPSLPSEGRVDEATGAGLPFKLISGPVISSQSESVRRQFSVHEDGALAYRIQEKEIEEHYGINRHNRRTVRQDIPVAKVVQTQEDIEQQKERLRKLAALQAQAEADEIVARRINRQVQDEVRRNEVVQEIEDEELARQLQEKEKLKYERYLEKRRERKLKKEREKLEQQLVKTTEEARLAVPHANGTNADQARQDMAALRLQGASPSANSVTRVTPSGRIEDEGDFSDFFAVPPDGLLPEEWEYMQQQQDEELARLLQEQEHKRTKAEVDREKLREIEMRDEQLAAIIQEQELLKEKKYQQKRHQQKEQHRLERQQSGHEGLPLGASANMLSQMQVPKSPVTADHNHHRYRRNSYTKSIDNGPAPMDYGPAVSKDARSRTGASTGMSGGSLDGRPQMPLPQNQGSAYKTVIDIKSPNSHSRSHAPLHQVPPPELSPDDAPEVLRWLQSQGTHDIDPHIGQRPSPTPDHCNEEVSRLSTHQNSFNIATAIDPTYHRRQNQLDTTSNTHLKTAVPVSRSLPLTDGAIEWEPGVRGSLRRLRGTLNPILIAQDKPSSANGSHFDSSFEDSPQAVGFQPVQGQKRSTVDNRNRKARKPNGDPKGGKNSNCKQQ